MVGETTGYAASYNTQGPRRSLSHPDPATLRRQNKNKNKALVRHDIGPVKLTRETDGLLVLCC